MPEMVEMTRPMETRRKKILRGRVLCGFGAGVSDDFGGGFCAGCGAVVTAD